MTDVQQASTAPEATKRPHWRNQWGAHVVTDALAWEERLRAEEA